MSCTKNTVKNKQKENKGQPPLSAEQVARTFLNLLSEVESWRIEQRYGTAPQSKAIPKELLDRLKHIVQENT